MKPNKGPMSLSTKTHLTSENLKTGYHDLNLSGIEAISSLVLLFEKKDFLQKKHLIIASNKDLEKLKSFLYFKKPPIPWYHLPSFPEPKSPYSESIRIKRRKWQAWAGSPKNLIGLFLASPQALLKKSKPSLKHLYNRTRQHFFSSRINKL